MPETTRAARQRPSPVDCRIRLLLDPYLCVGPGCEAHAATLFGISQHCAALGITLCVERQAWVEAARDPDVIRRRVDLYRFEPVVKLDALAAPRDRDAAAPALPARGETAHADLKLLGALQAQVADYLIALDDRIHGLAARAGLSSRVLTPADTLDWLLALAGRERPVALRELEPRTAITLGPLRELIGEECEPCDPGLLDRLAAGRGRVFVSLVDGDPVALGIVEAGSARDRIGLTALAAAETVRGARVLEPILSAALGMARRRGVVLTALLPPRADMTLGLLAALGFRPAGAGPGGREQWLYDAAALLPRPPAGGSAWVLPLDSAAHDQLLPEMSGASQAQLFAVGTDSRPQTLGSTVRKQIILSAGQGEPSPGDLLLFFHGRAPRRAASASLTCVARVEQTRECSLLEEVLALNAPRPGCSLAALQSRLAEGPVTVLDALMLGRLERFLPLPWLKEVDALKSAPRGLTRLPADAWTRITGRLALA